MWQSKEKKFVNQLSLKQRTEFLQKISARPVMGYIVSFSSSYFAHYSRLLVRKMRTN